MKYRKLEESGDYTFGLGNSGFYKDADAATQAVKTKLNLFEGDWWENPEDGLPLFQSILRTPGTAGNIVSVDLMVQSRIMQAPHVNGITSYSSSYEGGKYAAQAVVETDFGSITVGVG